ncbi:MAG: cyclic-di-GMP-binding biofilm dispersal mediator protein [Acidimicrobiales bacterium]|jgi:cyclic-di-GMP-binding biofilm dispersal mediator protein
MTGSPDGADQRLGGLSILVPGATGGLGSTIERNLNRRGANLTLVSRRRYRQNAPTVPGHRLALDLREPDSCQAAIVAAIKHAGRLDVVSNAGGVVAFGPIDELSVDAME